MKKARRSNQWGHFRLVAEVSQFVPWAQSLSVLNLVCKTWQRSQKKFACDTKGYLICRDQAQAQALTHVLSRFLLSSFQRLSIPSNISFPSPLRTLTTLVHLKISFCTLYIDPWWNEIAQLQNLEILHMSWTNFDLPHCEPALFSSLRSLPKLHTLILDYFELTKEDLENIASLAQVNKLELSNCTFAEPEDFPQIDQLQELSLGGLVSDLNAMLPQVIHFSNLKKLNLLDSEFDLTPLKDESLTRLLQQNQLDCFELDLYRPWSIAALLGQRRIRELCLTAPGLQENEMLLLAGLRTLEVLTVALVCNMDLAPLCALPKLRVLKLIFNKFSDEELDSFCPPPQLKAVTFDTLCTRFDRLLAFSRRNPTIDVYCWHETAPSYVRFCSQCSKE